MVRCRHVSQLVGLILRSLEHTCIAGRRLASHQLLTGRGRFHQWLSDSSKIQASLSDGSRRRCVPSCRTAQLVGRGAAKGAAGSMTSLGVWDQLELGRKASGASGKCIRHGWPAKTMNTTAASQYHVVDQSRTLTMHTLQPLKCFRIRNPDR